MTILVTAKKLKLGELGDKLVDMTREEVIAAGVGHIISMEEPSRMKGEGDSCAYNGDDEHGDTCCAAAPFIKEYDSEMEGKTWSALTEKGWVSSNHLEIINRLQRVHDSEYIFDIETQKRKKLIILIRSLTGIWS